jgi:hypothetical protein
MLDTLTISKKNIKEIGIKWYKLMGQTNDNLFESHKFQILTSNYN